MNNCSGSTYLLVGATSATNETEMLLAATGLTTSILTNTSTNTTAYLENGAYWYRLPGYSFGFSPNS